MLCSIEKHQIARSMPYSFGRSDAPIAPVPADWRTSHWPGSAVTPIHGGNYGEQVYMSPYGTMPFVANEAVPAPAPSVLPAAPVIMLAPPLVPPPSSAAAALGHGGPGHASSSIAAMALSHGNCLSLSANEKLLFDLCISYYFSHGRRDGGCAEDF
jgi:hypothetical protein